MTRLDGNRATVIVVLCTLFLACGGCGKEPVKETVAAVAAETDVPWGEAVGGLLLRVEAARGEYVRGAPILVLITLHNAGAEPCVLTRPMPEGAPPVVWPGLGWGRGLAIMSAGEGEALKKLPPAATHGDTEAGPGGYMPVYRFKGRLEPGQSQSILQFIRKPEFPAGARRFQAVLYLRGREIEAPEIVVDIREVPEQDPGPFIAEERRTISANVASLHNYCYGNRQLNLTRLKVLPVVRKALTSDAKTVDCEYALYIGVLQAVETRDATPDDVAMAKEAGEALLKRFPDSWLAEPVRDALANFAAKAKYAAWGEAVEGVQVRLRADKVQWKAGETPTFKAEIRNEGKRELSVAQAQELAELEVDGKWYRWGANIIYLGNSGLRPGNHYKNIPFTLDERWQTKDDAKPLTLAPGEHAVRVAFIAVSLENVTGRAPEPIRVISNPVEIEILAAGE